MSKRELVKSFGGQAWRPKTTDRVRRGDYKLREIITIYKTKGRETMRQKVVKVMIGQKDIANQNWRYGLQIFAGEGGDDPDDNPDDDPDDDPDDRREKKYSDEDVDKMFERKFAEWQKKQEKARKKQDEAERLRSMNAQEKEQHEKEELQKRVDELLKKDALASMSKTARGMLSEKNINVGDELVGMLINEDADQTKEAVETFIKAFQDAVNAEIKERLKGKPPKTGESSAKMTKEQIMAVKNPRERQKLISEHMDLFR